MAPPPSTPEWRKPPFQSPLNQSAPLTEQGASVHLVGALSNTEQDKKLRRLNSLRKKLLKQNMASTPPSRPTKPKSGLIGRVITQVLTESVEPMRVSAIHRAVEQHLSRSINLRSVRSCLSAGALGPKPRFQRTSHGCYRHEPGHS